MRRRIAVLGSTGSIGVQALQILADHTDRFDVVALTAHRSEAPLVEQVARWQPTAACLVQGKPSVASGSTAWFDGADGILEALDASRPDLVLNGITGAAGLAASEWTLRHGVHLALANKESLVIAGEHLMGLASESGAKILPVDSEHCAVFQCLNGERLPEVRRIWLTGSGGPFRTRPLDTFDSITPAEALRHPTWDMGPRITVGSATMMNKAFEILEAHWLFGLEPERIRVILHPQSIVHSMVEFVDGSILAQLGVPDMRVPILYCLGWPDRLPFPAFEPFDPLRFAHLGFEEVEADRYPAIELAYDVLRRGGDSGAVFNAADEVATEEFLAGAIRFPDIVSCVRQTLQARNARPVDGLQAAFAADQEARDLARHLARACALPDASRNRS
ncbi:MAG: 1-deoxy-D-xylulose-5-phosphate reductoisomerase [Planctomycetota bacterium]